MPPGVRAMTGRGEGATPLRCSQLGDCLRDVTVAFYRVAPATREPYVAHVNECAPPSGGSRERGRNLMISDCRGYHPRDYFTTSELVKRYFHTLTAPQSFASGAARVLYLCAPLRPSERPSRPLGRRTSTATARTSCAPRRVSRSLTPPSAPASIGCTHDARPCSSRSPRASRPCSRAPARRARRPAGVLPEASRRWAGRISSTARRAHARGGRARLDLSGGVGFASTPRAPHRLAHVAQPICITDKAVQDGSAWFRVVLIFRPSRAPTTRRWRW